MNEQNIVWLGAYLLITAIGLYAIRKIVHWYFCIDEHLENQKEQIRLLKKIADDKEIE